MHQTTREETAHSAKCSKNYTAFHPTLYQPIINQLAAQQPLAPAISLSG